MEAGLREDLRDAVDDVWAETVRHLPVKGGQPDPDRVPVNFEAVLRTGDQEVERVSFGRGNYARAGVAAGGGGVAD